jgi:hypothetical protein
MLDVPITVTARSEAWTVLARSKAGIVGSNPTQGMDICVCVYFVFVLCVGRSIVMSWSLVQGVLRAVKKKNYETLKVRPGPNKEV